MSFFKLYIIIAIKDLLFLNEHTIVKYNICVRYIEKACDKYSNVGLFNK